MSTIERAAERLGSIGKRGPSRDLSRDSSRDSLREKERTEPELRPLVDSSADIALVDSQASDDSPTFVPPEPAAQTGNEEDRDHVARARGAASEAPIEGKAVPAMFIGGGYVELDLEALAAAGFVTAANVESDLATDFRRIKRPLLLAIKKAESAADRHNPPNLVVVTSSLANEGKTFTCLNLALSIAAEMDRSVLLVDGDVAKSSVTEVLGIEPRVGLTDVLNQGGNHIEDAVLQTNVEGLSVLASGPRLPNTDELFASEMMRRVMRELAEQDPRRLVLMDAPPLLARTEAPNLARLAGHVVVIVEADKTPQANVTEALALLDGCEQVSLVLNKVTRRGSDRHAYGYGYGYGARGNARE